MHLDARLKSFPCLGVTQASIFKKISSCLHPEREALPSYFRQHNGVCALIMQTDILTWFFHAHFDAADPMICKRFRILMVPFCWHAGIFYAAYNNGCEKRYNVLLPTFMQWTVWADLHYSLHLWVHQCDIWYKFSRNQELLDHLFAPAELAS